MHTGVVHLKSTYSNHTTAGCWTLRAIPRIVDAMLRGPQNEIPLSRRVAAALALAGTASDMLEFAMALSPLPSHSPSALGRVLRDLGPSLKPDDLLQHLTQNDLVRPTFEVERKVKSFSHFPDLLKQSFLDREMVQKFDLTTDLLKDLQKRLGGPRLGTTKALPDPALREESVILDCAYAHLNDTHSLIMYNHVRLDATVTPNHRSGPFRKLRELKSSTELRAAWERRSFSLRSPSPVFDFSDDFCQGGSPFEYAKAKPGLYQDTFSAVRTASPNAFTESLPPPYESIPNASPCRGEVGFGPAYNEVGGLQPASEGISSLATLNEHAERGPCSSVLSDPPTPCGGSMSEMAGLALGQSVEDVVTQALQGNSLRTAPERGEMESHTSQMTPQAGSAEIVAMPPHGHPIRSQTASPWPGTRSIAPQPTYPSHQAHRHSFDTIGGLPHGLERGQTDEGDLHRTRGPHRLNYH